MQIYLQLSCCDVILWIFRSYVTKHVFSGIVLFSSPAQTAFLVSQNSHAVSVFHKFVSWRRTCLFQCWIKGNTTNWTHVCFLWHLFVVVGPLTSLCIYPTVQFYLPRGASVLLAKCVFLCWFTLCTRYNKIHAVSLGFLTPDPNLCMSTWRKHRHWSCRYFSQEKLQSSRTKSHFV